MIQVILLPFSCMIYVVTVTEISYWEDHNNSIFSAKLTFDEHLRLNPLKYYLKVQLIIMVSSPSSAFLSCGQRSWILHSNPVCSKFASTLPFPLSPDISLMNLTSCGSPLKNEKRYREPCHHQQSCWHQRDHWLFCVGYCCRNMG